jgi:UDP-N-acetylmuramoyl-tripeptide--D-alanyl-D-alanine ligase
VPEQAALLFEDAEAAAAYMARTAAPGDVVLVKGSRGIRLERVVARLRGSHEEGRG